MSSSKIASVPKEVQREKLFRIYISVALVLLTIIVYWPVKDYDFINFDDNVYVYENGYVQSGLSWNSVSWAFSVESMERADNWHPLTWLSLMLDYQIFALNPHGFHLINLLFHVFNTILLFLIFHRMTRTLWQSAFVACLFAVHPLHVESIAWVAERKDVLSAFFWMITMGAYIHYVERPVLCKYLPVLLFFVLGLMAKPMLVTLPFVLLLLDYWPLHRFQEVKSICKINLKTSKTLSSDDREGASQKNHAVKNVVKTEKPADYKFQWSSIRPLLWEKAPLFVLTAISSIVTYIAQQKGGAIQSINNLPMCDRIANAFVSYIIYIGKMLWPSNLAVYYPHPGLWPLWQVLGAALILITVTLTVIRRAERFPYLAMGWLWYVGTLMPVIGIVQVGSQARADRYTYIPLIGLFIMAAWGIPELLNKWHYQKKVLFALSILSLVFFLIVTWTQVRYWQNSFTLFDHALKVTDHNSLAYSGRGFAYNSLGNYRQAIEDYNRAIEINPRHEEVYNNRAVAYYSLGNYRQAIEDYDRAVEINPRYEEAYNNRGIAYNSLGNYRQAVEDYNRAIEINPRYEEAYNNRGIAYNNLGNYRKAIEDLKTAARFGDENAKKILSSQEINLLKGINE